MLKVKNLAAKKWLIILLLSFGGAGIGAFSAYLFPRTMVESEAVISLGKDEDQIRFAFEVGLSLPKCSSEDIRSTGSGLIQKVMPVKAAPRYINVSVVGDNIVAVKRCLLESVDFILKYHSLSSDKDINLLRNEIDAIDRVLNFNIQDNASARVGGFALMYPQELLLRKYKILQKIAELERDKWRLVNQSTSQNSLSYLVMLRVVVGMLVGIFIGLFVIVYGSQSFGIISMPKS